MRLCPKMRGIRAPNSAGMINIPFKIVQVWMTHLFDAMLVWCNVTPTIYTAWWWLEHEFYDFPYWECRNPNWRTPSFFRGVGQPPSSISWWLESQPWTWSKKVGGWLVHRRVPWRNWGLCGTRYRKWCFHRQQLGIFELIYVDLWGLWGMLSWSILANLVR